MLFCTEFGTLAGKHNSVNLAQGAPDFDAPDFVLQAAHVISLFRLFIYCEDNI
jgi:aspartate/methionine/tyrosine aminotransferase